MAIITATTWQAYRGTTVTGDDLTSAAAICAAVDQAIRRAIFPFVPEPTTVTDCVFDAIVGPALELPVIPVRSITSLYVRWGANGDATAFTSDDLLTNYDDYYLPIDDPVRAYSRSGVVHRRGGVSWGYELRRPYGRLAWAVDPNRGAVKVTMACGPTSVPDDLFMVAANAVTLLYTRRSTGAAYASESWNGRSQSLAGPFLSGALSTPDALEVLANYRPATRFAVGG